MKREIVVEITNIDLAILLEAWKPKKEIDINIDKNRIFVTLKNKDEPELEAIERLSKTMNFNFWAYYKAWDFDSADLDKAQILAFYLKEQFEGLRIVNNNPVITDYCPVCGEPSEELDDAKVIEMTSLHQLDQLVVETEDESLVLFHQSLVNGLEAANIKKGLEIRPCKILGPNGSVNHDYYWVYSKVDLGIPIGNVEFRECPRCGKKETIKWHTFLQNFKSENWDNSDFGMSSFFSKLSIYISNRVYRYLVALPQEDSDNFKFVPAELVSNT